MSSKDIAAKFIFYSNARDFDSILELLSDDEFLYKEPSFGVVKTKSNIIDHLKKIYSFYTDCQGKILSTIESSESSEEEDEEGKKKNHQVAMEVIWSGTHDGTIDFPGIRKVEGTGKTLTLPSSFVFEIDSSTQKIKSIRNYFDFLMILMTVGAIRYQT